MDSSIRHDLRQEWHVGKQVVLVKTIRQTDLKYFARLMQVDGEKIEQSESCDGFPEERVAVPVMLLGGLIGAAIDRYFCEAGSSCLNQYLEFIAPAYAGDTVTATLEIDQVQTDRPIIRLKTACTNQHGQALVTGQAVILTHKEVNRD
ncbi:MAG: hypothetical protein N2646_08700 [Bellilinea sp.]|nr:hypothetical protein [Bellilinea sp.]